MNTLRRKAKPQVSLSDEQVEKGYRQVVDDLNYKLGRAMKRKSRHLRFSVSDALNLEDLSAEQYEALAVQLAERLRDEISEKHADIVAVRAPRFASDRNIIDMEIIKH